MRQPDPRDPRTKNFRFTADDKLAPSGQQSRLRANIRALATLRFVENEGRLALPGEKKVLAGYSGWGALKEALNSTVAQIRELKDWDWRRKEEKYLAWEKNWGMAYNELKASLLESEFRAAQASTLNAHYTSPEVVAAMWDIALRLGYQGGRILEPSCGTGNFFGMMPSAEAAKSDVVGVEIDPVTARIAAALYPQVRILDGGFEDARVGVGSVTLAIGNVPFEQVGPVDRSKPMDFNLHNYFFAHTIEKLAPGGIMLYITSAYTMDASGPQALQRKYIAERTEMVGAIRLPNTAFKAAAGTEVVTDIICLRKPDGVKVLPQDESWARTQEIRIGEGDDAPTRRLNEYFVRHPEMVLGRHAIGGGLYGNNEYTVEAPDGFNLRAALARMVEKFPQGILNREVITLSESEQEGVEAEHDQREFSFHLHEDRIHQVHEGRLVPVANFTMKQDEVARDWIALRDAYDNLISSEIRGDSDVRLSAIRADLGNLYDSFVLKHGHLNDPKTKLKHLEEDPEFYRVNAVENTEIQLDEEERVIGRKYTKADCFTKRTVAAAVEPTEADGIDDALAISLAWRGRIDIPFIESLIGDDAGPRDEIEAALEATGRVLRDPLAGGLLPREEVLSGNVRRKLEAAQRASEHDAERYEATVKALEEVQPPWQPVEAIGVKIGATWIPDSIMTEFLGELFADNSIKAHYSQHTDSWAVENAERCRTAEALSNYGTDRMPGPQIIQLMLNLKDLSVYDTVDLGEGRTKKVYNPAQSELVRQKGDAISRAFRAFCSKEEVRGEIERTYNETLNNYVAPVWDGSHLEMPGLSDAFTRKDHQLGVVWRMLQERHGVIYHDVGFGKTLSAIMLSREVRRLSIARKPMIVVENATIRQFAESYRAAYPAARVLVATEATFNTKNRRRFLASIASNDWDAVIVAHSQFDLIPVKPERLEAFYDDQMEHLEAAILESKAAGSKINQRDAERKKRALVRKLDKLAKASEERQDDAIYWEDLGVDFLTIDECHRYKKPPFVTKLDRVKGFSNDESQRALNGLLKIRSVQEKHGGGRGVVGMSGTAITNQMAEAWVQMHLFSPEVLENFGCETFDRFCGSYCEKVTGIELNEATNKFRVETRLSKFTNGQSLISAIRASMDIQMDASKIGLVVPEVERTQTIVPLAPANKHINKLMARVYKGYERSSHKAELSYVPIMLMQVGMAASVDPRLILPDLNIDEKETVLGTVADDVLKVWKETSAEKGTQLIFADRYRPMNISALTGIIADAPSQVEFEDGTDDENVSEEEEAMPAAASFNLYREMTAALVRRGIPAEQIAVVHDHDSQVKKKALFDKVNRGEVRVMIGSTTKMGVGVNVQRRLVKIHKIDANRNMTPADERQRDGRIVRQGNSNKQARIAMYGMEGTTAAGIYDRIARKDKFISQLLAGNGVGSDFDDPMGSLTMSSAEMKAKIIGDPRVERQVQLTEAVREARVKRESFYAELSSDRRRLDREKKQSAYLEERVATYARYSAICADRFDGTKWGIKGTFRGEAYEDGGKEEVASMLDKMVDALENAPSWESRAIQRCEINGVPCVMRRYLADSFGKSFQYVLEVCDPDNAANRTMREITVKSGVGALKALTNSAAVLAREEERCARAAETARSNVIKITAKINESPSEYPGEDEISALSSELAAIETELLEAEKEDEEALNSEGCEESQSEPEEYAADRAMV